MRKSGGGARKSGGRAAESGGRANADGLALRGVFVFFEENRGNEEEVVAAGAVGSAVRVGGILEAGVI